MRIKIRFSSPHNSGILILHSYEDAYAFIDQYHSEGYEAAIISDVEQDLRLQNIAALFYITLHKN